MNSLFKRFGLFVILYFFVCTCINAQIRFNKNYDCNQFVNMGSGILELSDGYLTAEEVWADSDSAIGTLIRKIDLNGNEQWQKLLYKPESLLYPSFNTIQLNNNGILWVVCNFVDTIHTLEPSDGFLVKMNLNGDSLGAVKIGGQFKDVLLGSHIDSDGSVISVGKYGISSATYDAWAVKTDSLGNVIWDKKFGGGNGDTFGSVINAPDGGYYLIGASNSFNIYDDVYVVKVDVDGNLQWQKNFPTPKSDGGAGGVISNNKLYITGFAYTDYPNSYLYDGILLIADLAGNQIDYKTLGGATLSNSFRTNPLALNDGSIVVAGESRTLQNPNSPWGWLYKFNENGDSIWARTYNFNPIVPNYIYDLKATADGGFIMAGSTHSSPVSGGQDAWILKVDEYGCDTANCNIYDAVKEVKTIPIVLSATPNPFSNETTISYQLSSNVQQAEIRIIEMATGKVVKTIVVNDNSAQNYMLESSFMSAGIYAVQLFANQVLVNTIKVVNIK